MKNSIASETQKLLTLPACAYCLVASLVLPAFSGWIFGFKIASQSSSFTPEWADIAFQSLELTQVAFLIFGVIAVTSEYRSTIRTTLVVNPRRMHVFSAKLLVVGVAALLGAIIAVAMLLASTRLSAGPRMGTSLELGRVSCVVIYLVASTLMSAAVGFLVRNAVTGISVTLGYFLIIGPLLRQYLEWTWIPDAAGTALSYPVRINLSTWQAWLVLLGWTAGLLLAAGLTFRHRDA